MGLLLHFLRPTDIFVDVGANIGSYTVLASRVIGAQTFAFEPIPATFLRLQRNLRVNGIEHRVIAHQMAVGANPATLRFSADDDTKNKSVTHSYRGRTTLAQVETLDHLIGNIHPAMWKVDVEGFESEVLSGAACSLADPALSVIVLEGESENNSRMLEQAGFIEMDYDPLTRGFSRYRRASGTFCNHIWIRGIDDVQKRCKDGRQFAVIGLNI
jgi:FkbM family methyltransferase